MRKRKPSLTRGLLFWPLRALPFWKSASRADPFSHVAQLYGLANPRIVSSRLALNSVPGFHSGNLSPWATR